MFRGDRLTTDSGVIVTAEKQDSDTTGLLFIGIVEDGEAVTSCKAMDSSFNRTG